MYKGIVNDVHPTAQPEATYRWAVNKMVTNRFDALSDAYPVVKQQLFSRPEVGDFQVIGKIPLTEGDHALMLSVRGRGYPDFSELGILSQAGVYTPVIKDKLLDYLPTDYIKGSCITNFDGSRSVVYTNGRGPVRLINVDRPGVELDTNLALKYPQEIVLLNFFPAANVPYMDKVRINDAGGMIASGVYSIAIQYEIEDGGFTNFIYTYNPIPITDSKEAEGFNEYGGCDAGTITSKSITMQLSNLDTRYDRFRVAVVKTIGGVTSAEIISTLDVPESGVREFTYTGGEVAEPIPTEDVLVGFASYDRVDALTFDGYKLWLAGLHRDEIQSAQESANNISVKWAYEDTVSLNGVRGSFKDGATVFLRKSFLPDEVYAFYIAWKLLDGSYSSAYHIPGRPVDVVSVGGNSYAENEKIATIKAAVGSPAGDHLDEDILIDPNIKYFHTRDTSKNDGTLGYWENEEQYPDWFPGLGGQNVRHHKMPSLKTLDTKGFIETSAGGSTAGGSASFSADLTLDDPPAIDTTITNNIPVELASVGGDYIEFTEDVKATLKWDVDVTTEGFGYARAKVQYVIRETATNQLIRVLGTNEQEVDQLIEDFPEWQPHVSATALIKGEEVVDIQAGWKIGFEFEGEGDYINVFFRPTDVTVSQAGGELEVAGTRFTKSLGIQLEGITVPAALEGKVQGFEIFYAKRTLGNSTVVSQSALFGTIGDNPATPTGTNFYNFRFHGPDLLANEAYPGVAITHLKRDFTIGGNQFSEASTYTANGNDNLHQVREHSYTPHDEFKREAALLLETTNPIDMDSLQLATLHSFKKNAYSLFTEQELVSTGRVFPYTTESTPRVYGGDQHISVYGVRLTPGTSAKVYSFVVFSAVNAGLRQEGEGYGEKYFPKSTIPDDFGTVPEGITADDISNYVEINPDYTKVNEYNRAYPFNGGLKRINDFPQRIAGSPVLKSEGEAGLLRAILPGDYYDISKYRGAITNIEHYQGELLIHTEESLFKTVGRMSMQSSEQEIVLGAGDIFKVPPTELLPSVNGAMGLQYINAATMTKYGYLFVNADLGKAYLVNDKVEEITNTGIKQWAQENFRLKINDSLRLSALDGLSGNAPYSEAQIGFAVGSDEENDRLLITKKDYSTSAEILQEDPVVLTSVMVTGTLTKIGPTQFTFASDELPDLSGQFNIRMSLNGYTIGISSITVDGSTVTMTTVSTWPPFSWTDGQHTVTVYYDQTGDDSKLYYHNGHLRTYQGYVATPQNTDLLKDQTVTMSYSISRGKFISAHTRHSDHFLDTPSGMLEISDKDLFKFAQSGEPQESWVDIVDRYPSIARVGSISWRSQDTNDSYGFTHVMVHNEAQCSGIIDLSEFELRRKDFWRFNRFLDIALSSNFLDEHGELIEDQIDHNKNWYDQKRFIDSYTLVRLINRNAGENVVHLYTVATRATVL